MIRQTASTPSVRLFAWGTAAYLFAVFVGALWLGYFNPKGKPIAPNEWGDVLAGVSSPLAFLWLLYAALAQRAELELQRQELRQNNETQREQQRELQRSADAMAAQTARIEAQATATYDPVFVIDTRRGAGLRGNSLNLLIANVGAQVINVTFSDNFSAEYVETPTRREPIGSSVVPHLQKGDGVIGDLEFDITEREKPPVLVIKFQRLDAVHKANVYEVVDHGERLQLKEALADDFGAGGAIAVQS